MPHLVEMRKKLEKDVVAIAVNLDDPKDNITQARVQEFTTGLKDVIPQYVLNEDEEVWKKKLALGGFPTVMVFGKDGRIVKRFEFQEFTYQKDVEPYVLELLKQK